MLLNGFAGQRLVLALGSAWALAALGSAAAWPALGSAGQRYWYWQQLAALGIYRQRLVLALLSAGQRLGFGSAGQRCGMGSAGRRWAALPSATSTGSAAQYFFFLMNDYSMSDPTHRA